MGDIVKVLTQIAGLGALFLVIAAAYYLYKALRARKDSRSALFGAERQSAADRAIRAALSSMTLFGLALLFFGIALLGESVSPTPATRTGTATPAGPRTPTASVSPAVSTPVLPSTEVAATAVSPTLIPTPSTEITTTTPPRKTAVVSGVGDNLLKLRRDPATTADIIAQYPDGTVLEVLEAQQTNQGIVWQRVRDAQGNEGWVANQYLVYNP